MLIETWPLGQLYVGYRVGEPVGLATLATPWLGVPADLQLAFNALHERRVQVALRDPESDADGRELELRLLDGGPPARVHRRRVDCEIAQPGVAQLECVLRRQGAPSSPPRDVPQRSIGRRLLEGWPALFWS